ncbi:L,D-transpeptidase [Candidatus Woesearchaeota archaeon]|nr:L,D-transpeptidase [Candidatus Woesearchaeota archaeon]
MTELDGRINDYGAKPSEATAAEAIAGNAGYPASEQQPRSWQQPMNEQPKSDQQPTSGLQEKKELVPDIASKKKHGARAYSLIGAGLIAAGTFFSVLNAGKMYDGLFAKAMRSAKEHPKQQVMIAEDELVQSPYANRLAWQAIAAMPGFLQPDNGAFRAEKSPQAERLQVEKPGTIDDVVDVAVVDVNAPSISKDSSRAYSSETPKVLDMMLGKEKKGKPEYVFVVDKETQRAKVYKLAYQLVDEADVSTGMNPGDKERAGDHKTPNGIFEVQSVQDSSNWRYGGELAYGPKAARLNAGRWDSKGNYKPDEISDILAHGTNEPEKLGSAASHGCVRFLNSLVDEYVAKGYLKKGTLFAIVENNDYVPTRIKAGPLMASNASDVYASNANQAEQLVQTVQKPANSSFEKYNNDKKVFVTEEKSENKAEAKGDDKKAAGAKGDDKKVAEAKGEIK